jgi:uncharacterized protein YbdZ (MbtH family)
MMKGVIRSSGGYTIPEWSSRFNCPQGWDIVARASSGEVQQAYRTRVKSLTEQSWQKLVEIVPHRVHRMLTVFQSYL